MADCLRSMPAPDWLQESWTRARELGLSDMTMDAIDEEIAAARCEPTPTAAIAFER